MHTETQEEINRRRTKLMESLELTQTGYAGIDKNGNKVDRRKHPDTMPLPYNEFLLIPHPKEINNRDQIQKHFEDDGAYAD